MALSTFIVNTGVVGGTGDGSNLANAYSSTAAAIAARATNLIGTGNSHLILTYATTGIADTSIIDTSAYGCSYTSGETLTIKCGDTITAAWNDAIYSVRSSNVAYVTRVYGSGIILDGLQIYLTGLNANYQLPLSITNASVGNPQVVKNCLIRNANQSVFRERGTYISIGINRQVYFYNNIIYNTTTTVAHTASNALYLSATDATCVFKFYKNVLSGGYNSIFYTTGLTQITAKNNIICNAANALFTNTPTWSADTGYNATDKATGLSTALTERHGQTFTFNDSVNGNFSLNVNDTGAKSFGVTLAADTPAVTTDRINVNLVTPFDIGAYQYVAPPSGESVNLISGLLNTVNIRGRIS
jgi:hypothetical protein